MTTCGRLEQIPGQCNQCDKPLVGRQTRWCSPACMLTWYENHLWTYARARAMRSNRSRCIRCGEWATEVDHIVERQGRPIHKASCLHHQDNLRPLCHNCHVNRRQWDLPDRSPLLGGAAP